MQEYSRNIPRVFSAGKNKRRAQASVAERGGGRNWKQGTTVAETVRNQTGATRCLARPLSRDGVWVALLFFRDRRYHGKPKPSATSGAGIDKTIEEILKVLDRMIGAQHVGKPTPAQRKGPASHVSFEKEHGTKKPPRHHHTINTRRNNTSSDMSNTSSSHRQPEVFYKLVGEQLNHLRGRTPKHEGEDKGEGQRDQVAA